MSKCMSKWTDIRMDELLNEWIYKEIICWIRVTHLNS